MTLCIVIYIWMEQCVWMELPYVWTMCMDETDVICDMWYETYVLDMWYETYVLDMWYIFAVIYICCENCWSKKNRKKRQYAGSLPSATDGKEIFAISSAWQRGHVAGNCASWEADLFGQFANSGWRQREKKTLPTAADGKGLPMFAVSGRRQRLAVNHLTE